MSGPPKRINRREGLQRYRSAGAGRLVDGGHDDLILKPFFAGRERFSVIADAGGAVVKLQRELIF